MKKNDLLNYMAQSCYYAQAHCGDPGAWSCDESERENYLQCTSFQIACFLAKNTVHGYGGVTWDVVIEELIDNTVDEQGMMVKSIETWKEILNKLVEELGGWKEFLT